MNSAGVPTLPRGVRMHFDKVRDTWVLLAPERTIMLDAIGHAILSELDGKRSITEIAEGLAAKYNAPLEQISKDCNRFLGTLHERRFLDVTP